MMEGLLKPIPDLCRCRSLDASLDRRIFSGLSKARIW